MLAYRIFLIASPYECHPLLKGAFFKQRIGMRIIFGGSHGSHQGLRQDLDFFPKRSYLIFLGSYLQKRGVIHS